MQRLHNRKYYEAYLLLGAGILPVLVFSVCSGAVEISVAEIGSAFRHLAGGDVMSLNERIFMFIRLPRVIMCIVVGGALAVGGVLMQAIFRNPIVEPGLIGTSSGAAFGASLFLVLGPAFRVNLPAWGMPLTAFCGGALATTMVLVIAPGRKHSFSPMTALLVTGIAINALFMSAVGFLSYIARDPQARSITFWNLGTLAGAGWQNLAVCTVVVIISLTVIIPRARQLNALGMGDDEAELMGIRVKELKRTILVANILMVSFVTSFCGVIAFVGLIVPHLMRIWKGNDNRFLVFASALAGGLLLLLADVAARMLLRPAELPIGILTAWVGVIVFIYLLRSKKFSF